MKIVVDANIVFSAILNTNSKIADLLLNSKGTFDFIAPDFLQLEIRKYHSKISVISKMSIREIEIIENKVFKPILFMSGIHIPSSKWLLAEDLTKDVDLKDTPYIAFSIFYKCKIWTGDKVLRSGLENKQFGNFISTDELFELREQKKNKNILPN